MDPSQSLSPVTPDRLARIAKHVEIKWGSQVSSVVKDGKKKKVEIKHANGDITTISTQARVVLFTGFNVTKSDIWNSLFHFVNGNPQVTQFDESTKVPNVFLSGPMLFHKLTSVACHSDVLPAPAPAPVNGEESGEQGVEEPDCDDSDTIIFCFIYKFGTRFAVIAGEIIRRIAKDKHTVRGMLDYSGQHMVQRAHEMQSFYQSNCMLVTDLSCCSFAWGMCTQDAPDYGYVFSDDEEEEEEEEV